MDWILEVHLDLDLSYSSLHLSVEMFDRYIRLAPKPIHEPVKKFFVTLLIASKFTEERPPSVRAWVRGFSPLFHAPSEAISIEKSILKVLDYRLMKPTLYSFLTRVSDTFIKHPKAIRMALRFLAEVSLLHREMRSFRPSTIAVVIVKIVFRGRELRHTLSVERYLELVACDRGLLTRCEKLLRRFATFELQHIRVGVGRRYESGSLSIISKTISGQTSLDMEV